MPTDSLPVDHIKVEVAFASTPDDPAPVWTDISPWVDLSNGVSITTGRGDEYATVQTGNCAVSLDNADGRFTAGNVSSPYYPNVKIRKKIRVSYQNPSMQMWNFSTSSTVPTYYGAGVPTVTGGRLRIPCLTTGRTGVTFGGLSFAGTLADINLFNEAIQPGTAADTDFFIEGSVPGTRILIRIDRDAGIVSYRSEIGYGDGSTITEPWTVNITNFRFQEKLGRVNFDRSLDNGATWTTMRSVPTPAFIVTDTTTLTIDVSRTSGTNDYVEFYYVHLSGPIDYRFTGYVEEWPTEWPGGTDSYAVSQVTASDRFKRLGQRAPLGTLIGQEYLADNPSGYYTLGEPTGSTTAGDTSKVGGSPLATVQAGVGGTLTFGANTGPPTDGLSAPAFTPTNVTNGKYLNGTIPSPVGVASFAVALTMEAFFLTSAAVAQILVFLRTNSGRWVKIATTAAGNITATNNTGDYTLTSASTYKDGLTHHVALTLSGSTSTLYVDGVSVATGTTGMAFNYLTISVGGESSNTATFTGTLAHVAVYNAALSGARILAHSQAGSTGFAGERSDQRVSRLGTYAGVPVAEQSLETGLSTSIAFVDTTGLAPLQAMQDIAATEGGVLFMDGAGVLTFQSRGHRYNSTSVFTVTAADIDPSTRFVINDALMVNDVTAGRAGGITVRAISPTSITDYGTSAVVLTLLTTSDNEVADAANWKANHASRIDPRLTNLTVDLLTSPALTATALLLGIGSRITLSGLPAQAPASSVDLFIEGWTERISSSGWILTWNTSPVIASAVWALGSSTYSQLGTSTVLGY